MVAPAWRASGGNLRLDGFVDHDTAQALHDALVAQEFEFARSPTDLFQHARYPIWPDDDCDHPICAFARWFRTDGAAWISAVTGRDLVGPREEVLVGYWYGKGGFLDLHNDFGKGRAVALVLGLTPTTWPAEEGGWLELHGPAGHVVERRPPGFGTADLLDVSHPRHPHQIPMLTTHQRRLTITGWWWPRVPGEGIEPGEGDLRY